MVKKWKILVIGDSCNDIYIYGKCDRLCPDAPVPVLLPETEIVSEGMSGNVVNNLKIFDVDVEHITNKNKITKTRYVDAKTNQMLVRIDVENDIITRIENIDKINYGDYDGVIISDYNKGFLYEEDISYICENHPNVFIDTKKEINTFCVKAKIIKINELEYSNSKKVISKLDISNSLITTLGSKGARYKNKLFNVEKVDIKDQTGAGDTFISALMYKYLETNNINDSIEFANKCATFVVQQRGVKPIIKDII